MFRQLFKTDAKNIKGADVPVQELIPTFHFDYKLILKMKGTLESFNAVGADVLLLGASRSPPLLKHSLDALDNILPNAKRVALKGLGHGAALDGGKPERVAQVLRRFFR
jgi:hypothetical protein